MEVEVRSSNTHLLYSNKELSFVLDRLKETLLSDLKLYKSFTFNSLFLIFKENGEMDDIHIELNYLGEKSFKKDKVFYKYIGALDCRFEDDKEIVFKLENKEYEVNYGKIELDLDIVFIKNKGEKMNRERIGTTETLREIDEGIQKQINKKEIVDRRKSFFIIKEGMSILGVFDNFEKAKIKAEEMINNNSFPQPTLAQSTNFNNDFLTPPPVIPGGGRNIVIEEWQDDNYITTHKGKITF